MGSGVRLRAGAAAIVAAITVTGAAGAARMPGGMPDQTAGQATGQTTGQAQPPTQTPPPQTAPAQTPSSVQTPPPTPAQSVVPAQTLEFDAAVQQAIAKNPTVAEAAAAISRASALLRSARVVRQPTSSVTATGALTNAVPEFEGISLAPRTQLTLTGDITESIYSPARWAAITQSMDQVNVAKVSTADARRQVAVEAADAYLAIIAARRQVDVEARALSNAQAHQDFAQKQLDAGSGTRVNEVRAAQEVSTDKTGLENAQLALLRSEEALGVLVTVDGPVAAGAEPIFDVPTSIDVAAGLSARTDVQLQRVTFAAAERVFNDSHKDWYPTGSVSFDPTHVSPSSFFQLANTWKLSVTFTQQLWDGGTRKAAAEQRASAVEQDKAAVSAIEIQARSDIRLAQESIASNTRALTSAQLAANQANDVLQITTSAFELGSVTNIEVIDAERTARDAESAAAVAEDAVRQAKLDLLVALGRFPK